ncbi:dicarboxylate/amino acid:cation symporter [Saccharothrix violaceirubra]|uniref:Na+/H+-dicarboxylate symporter n=1 Tax=Saccharothrix violaceirubra TaxID=413306 RepID=A0A7W7SY65_9PSEU|nr:dicarboxylate/amino acid:cation symporter [Saccharothrix violaceirubra]MBB4963118.1 Na+/H+-dicarboxylate symporter [Saccharothrix violaceirubra]
MSFIHTYRKPKVFGIAVLVALVLGALVGWLAKTNDQEWLVTTLGHLGDVFTSLLQLTVIPLVFTAIVVGITSLNRLGRTRAARLGGKTVLWFAITSLIAVLIGLAVALLVKPGTGVDVTPTDAAVKRLASREPGSWTTLVESLIPSNLFSAFTEGAVLQVVFIALLVGFAAFALGERAAPFVDFTRAAFDLVQKIVGWIVLLAPIGVFGLIGTAFATYGNSFVGPLFSLIVSVYVGSLIVLLVVYPVLLRFVGRVDPLTFFAKAWNAIQFAFVSRSSGATLPLSKRAAEDLGVDRDYAAFAVPLGTTTKMDGCAAVYPAVATVFIANLVDVRLGVWQYVAIVAVAVFGALATAGTTGWFTMLTLTLAAVGLPTEAIALGVAVVYAIDPILDMIRTATNVAGQITVPVLVARSEGLLGETTAPQPPPVPRRAVTA